MFGDPTENFDTQSPVEASTVSFKFDFEALLANLDLQGIDPQPPF
jgi:hypothetical protein